MNKLIYMSRHANDQLGYRGATLQEVVETIQNSPWHSAELKRLECRKDFIFNQYWNGHYYAAKQVRPIFIEEENQIVVITVYVYYF